MIVRKTADGAGVAQHFRSGAATVLREVARAEAISLRDAQRTAIRLSSGPYRTRQLRRMGHPYARRHGAPRLDASVINVQSGAFRAGWRVAGPRVTLGGSVGIVHNVDRKARLLELGTRTMFARPLPARVLAEIQHRREVRLVSAIIRALGG